MNYRTPVGIWIWVWFPLMLVPFLWLSGCDQGPSPHKLEEAWSARDAPLNLTSNFETDLSRLPWEARSTVLPWADSYWPNNRGGIAWRWQQGRVAVGSRLSLEALRRLNRRQLASLSPAEKYDILQGRYDYPLTQREKRRTSPYSPSWHGLCHGWAAASFQYREPDAVSMPNPDGLDVPFAASDLKALLTYVQQDQRPARATKFLGLRCNRTTSDPRRIMSDPACKGVNAGAFHIIMSSFLGLERRPFILDIAKGAEVWNMPAYGYRSQRLSQHHEVYASAAPGTTSIVEVATQLDYVYIVNPQPRALEGRSIGQYKKLNYRYTLELDERGHIIGGEWRSAERPDFLWLQTPAPFTAYFAKLSELYEVATQYF